MVLIVRQMMMLGLACGAVTISATGCLDNKLEEDDTPVGAKHEPFIAQTSDFAHYQDWMVFKHDVQAEHGGLLGKIATYVSESPDATTHQFAVGAIVVKTVNTESSESQAIHAMAKRGTGYNVEGARGWEYFELQLNSKAIPYIVWRGEQPPSGEQYQALLGANNSDQPTTEGKCNDCHAGGKDGMLGDDIVELLGDP